MEELTPLCSELTAVYNRFQEAEFAKLQGLTVPQVQQNPAQPQQVQYVHTLVRPQQAQLVPPVQPQDQQQAAELAQRQAAAQAAEQAQKQLEATAKQKFQGGKSLNQAEVVALSQIMAVEEPSLLVDLDDICESCDIKTKNRHHDKWCTSCIRFFEDLERSQKMNAIKRQMKANRDRKVKLLKTARAITKAGRR
jgi:CHAT domain-containing protein